MCVTTKRAVKKRPHWEQQIVRLTLTHFAHIECVKFIFGYKIQISDNNNDLFGVEGEEEKQIIINIKMLWKE